MVPGPLPPPVERRRASTLVWWALGSLVAVLAVTLVAASLVKVPYVVISPGTAYATNDRVTIGGGQQVYPPSGTIDFVTVNEKTEVSALERFIADRDPDAVVSPAKNELGTRSPKQDAALNLLLMRSSKDSAALVALTKLGYPVTLESLGAVITDISPDSPAARAGLLPGDSIDAVDGVKVTSSQALRDDLGARHPGDGVTLRIHQAQGDPRDVAVTLAEHPQRPGAGFVGVSTQDLAIPQLPFPVAVRSDDVGGPSAGLAFTLAIIDALTPGELTGGGLVAVTGTMGPDGTVGPIGGIEQKVVTVERAHAQIFVVPADDHCGEATGSCNYTDAKRKAGDRLNVVPVATLDEALAALAQLGGNGTALGTPGAPVSVSSPS